MIERNPFIISGYHSPELFCDREEETRTLTENAENGINTTLISIRRMGKTGLIWHTIEGLKKKKSHVCIYADIYATQNLQDFTNKLGSSILRAFPEKNSTGKKFMNLLKSLRPVLTYDSLTGQPQVSFTFATQQQYEQSLDSLFKFLESQDRQVLFALDEFQQIIRYPEKNIEAILRSHLQTLKNVNLIFSGSSRHLLSEMFANGNRPFFASTQFLYLQEIAPNTYKDFIQNLFRKYNRDIYDDALEYIVNFTRLHTFYTQSVCNRIFSYESEKITKDAVHQVCMQLLAEHENLFFQYRNLLTPIQWNLLKAIAREGRVYHPNAKAFLEKHKLGIPANVQRAIESLLNKEMIYKENDKAGTFYCVYDLFLSRWLESAELF
jgi:AAA+ ATPase superfamily predicted ATPase